jgi:DNA-binding MarR family transcriptional regulator
MKTPRWLTDEQQADWRAWIEASMMLREQLNRDLLQQHGLTMADYEILVQLSEHPEHRLRMSELASSTLVSRSRLSHQIDRMERAGLVRRQECTDDRRGFFATLTQEGLLAIQQAAPDHVQSVRTYLLDQMTEAEFRNLGDACRKILGGLQDESE